MAGGARSLSRTRSVQAGVFSAWAFVRVKAACRRTAPRRAAPKMFFLPHAAGYQSLPASAALGCSVAQRHIGATARGLLRSFIDPTPNPLSINVDARPSGRGKEFIFVRKNT